MLLLHIVCSISYLQLKHNLEQVKQMASSAIQEQEGIDFFFFFSKQSFRMY